MLELDIFQLTDAQLENEDEGYVMSECDIAPRLFIHIDSFGKYIDYDGLEYTSIYCGGMEFISMLSYEEFKVMYFKHYRIT